MILNKNPKFNELTINESEKLTLPFTCVCDLISFEDKPFLKGSRVVSINFEKSICSNKTVVNSSGFQVAS
ncbi:MAG: hypothetical protein L7U87_07285 [Chlamydiales bacterium]|nr:hypothetical protein [Chlamydiales bacterium]